MEETSFGTCVSKGYSGDCVETDGSEHVSCGMFERCMRLDVDERFGLDEISQGSRRWSDFVHELES